eukprot:jgi/Botrbrau1/7673/Bobra.0159s0115.1
MHIDLEMNHVTLFTQFCTCPFGARFSVSRIPGPVFRKQRTLRLTKSQACVTALIRRAGTQDLPALTYIEAVCAGTWSEGQLLDQLERSNGIVLVAEVEHVVCGLIICWLVVDEVQILELAVRPEVRRKGIGRALMQSVCQEGKSVGAQLVLLEVSAENGPAIALYVSLNFEAVGRRKAYYSDGSDAILMTKQLAS